MALTVIPPTQLIHQLEGLEKELDGITEKMLDAGVQEVLPAVEAGLDAAITKGYATGGLARSLVVKKNNRKKERFITFTGVSNYQKDKNGRLRMRRKPERNNEIAGVLEHGKADQEPHAFLRPAFIAKEGAIEKAIEQTFEKETKKYRS